MLKRKANEMVKARALRRRYILFEFRGQDCEEQDLKKAIYAEALKFFGEYGLSFVALKLVAYSKEKKLGVLRCEREKLQEVLGFLALVNSLGNSPARLISLKTSGTLKSLRESHGFPPQEEKIR